MPLTAHCLFSFFVKAVIPDKVPNTGEIKKINIAIANKASPLSLVKFLRGKKEPVPIIPVENPPKRVRQENRKEAMTHLLLFLIFSSIVPFYDKNFIFAIYSRLIYIKGCALQKL